ncbi:hypothetical protein OPT61_g10483 [Boeremia exigua]|uniref:Uncharacterized protein n=1 Tax=Boeremia exigua TaxID=749465 RepID=A0ACC2HPN8_9PLEO|nr:hypothetical protein OPT61_g10483 [Boeremia exigua]
MKQERSEALAEAAFLTKRCDDLRADLKTARSSKPHLQKADPSSDDATAVIPIKLKIASADFLKLSAVFTTYQASITGEMQRWYNDWKPKDPFLPFCGSAHAKEKSRKRKIAVILDMLYADMGEFVDGQLHAGAEQVGSGKTLP